MTSNLSARIGKLGANIVATALTVTALTTNAVQAGGIERSNQSLAFLFEQGRLIELSFGRIAPELSGTDRASQQTGNVAQDFTQLGLSYKYDVNDQMSFALIVEQPYGADIAYGPGSTILGGTRADASSLTVTGVLRYKFNDTFSAFGGLRAQEAKATIDMRGLAYGPATTAGSLNGYLVDFAGDWGLGYVVGVAYEKPEIALRVALTYSSAIRHEFATTENFAPGGSPDTSTKTPQSVNLEFQSGVAANTLIFGHIRWVDWSGFTLRPDLLAGSSLVNLEDTTTYTLGVGRKFNTTWSGAFSISFEEPGNRLVSPLAPYSGRMGATLAAIYTRGPIKMTTGINYTKLGNANAQARNAGQAEFSDNDAVGVGVKIG